ncbi:MAG: hypothetical protein NTW62_03110 [Candidatus Nomurabacteria bacterium]|nr:hypothetical protein [Candidatus Nomurabacteria bacterium]
MITNLIKIFLPTTIAFVFGIFFTPFATHYFFKYKMWKKKLRNKEDDMSLAFQAIHEKKEKGEASTPCVGGIIIWVSVLFTTLLFFILSIIFQNDSFAKLNFLSRSQTFIPFTLFILGSILGLIDDLLEINGKSNITRDSNWYTKLKLSIVTLFGLLSGYWFFFKLGIHSIHIPFGGSWELGLLIIPFVILVMLGSFSGGIIDGLDGLSGGVLASIFASYSFIGILHNQIDIAAFCGVVTGAILAFLWFNIPPARFYMGETGIMPLTIVIAVLAFLTNTVLILPIIAFLLVITSLSSTIQIISKKYFGKKIFRVAPLHHHFESLGWPSYKVTMRYWVLSVIFAIIGIILAMIS